MGTGAIAEAPFNGNNFPETTFPHAAEPGAPPLVPAGMPAAPDHLLWEDAVGPVVNEHLPDQSHFFQQADLLQTSTGLGLRQKLFAGTVVVTALGLAALAYLLFGTAAEQLPKTQTAVSRATVVQAAPETPVEVALATPQRSAEQPAGVAWPDVPSPLSAAAVPQASPEAASPNTVPASLPIRTAATGNMGNPQPLASVQKPDVVFLQRPGVNIRSVPSPSGPVLGTAAKGTRFSVTGRQGDWVQVEKGRLKGWVNSQFLAANRPH